MSPDLNRDWRLYAEDIIEACGKVRRYVAGMTREAFLADERTQDAVMRNIEIIGEAAKGIPRQIAVGCGGRSRGPTCAACATFSRTATSRVPGYRLGDRDDPNGRAGGRDPQAARPPSGP